MSFDHIAPHYRWIEAICAGSLLQRCRTEFLTQIQPRRALIVGEGNGRFLAELVRAHPAASVTCVDASAEMLRLVRARIAGLDESRVEFVCADIHAWQPPRASFDLIVTHFFLDCFPARQLASVIARLAAAAAPGARWLLADFREPAAGPARWRACVILALLYGFFRCVAHLAASRLTPPDPLLADHGFTLDRRRTWSWGLLHSDLWRAA